MLKKMQGMFKKSGSVELPEKQVPSPTKSAKLSDAPQMPSMSVGTPTPK